MPVKSNPADALYAAIGRRLRTTREARGWNQAAVGRAIGLGRSSICNIEAGRSRISVAQLVAAAQALEIEVEQLLAGPLPELIQPTPQPAATARPFWLQRNHDVSGVSGTGIVAHGVLWPDGTASVRWAGVRPSIVFWDGGMADAEAVHGHGGATRIVFADQAQQDPAPAEHCIHDAAIHHRHHNPATPVDGCPWCEDAGTDAAQVDRVQPTGEHL